MNCVGGMLRLGVLLCVSVFSFGCAGGPGFPVLTSSSSPETLVCGYGEVQYCERLSGFVWGQCECVRASPR